MRINTNVSAMTTLRYLNQATDAKSSALTKLSSGSRINSAADDAAGLAVSEKMKAQIGGLTQAQSNAQDGVSLIQTAEGGLSQIQTMLDRMRDLAVQSSNGTLGTDDRKAIDKEFGDLKDEITRIAGTTQFNNKNLLGTSATATAATTFTFQVGANANQTLSVQISAMNASALGLSDKIDIVASQTVTTDNTTADIKSANAAITAIDSAIATVTTQRSTLGATQNRLNYAISNLETSNENLSEANSRIRDVDMAQEMTQFTKDNILTQAATSMLAQANAMPNSVLTLLQG
ncbi:flagellin [Liquorilactobacillus nagelii]|jgi:flagellin|uniref:flagellin N-terminal helical domain-containing protein n=1 Tax=Liquorilactobacillus nagelii TaxID=82688 RepID=UPI00242D2726|nr:MULTISPECIES: flagellin [Lactobacillales]MCI1633840.1 flagellin [Liquorilactobacillus nagelii]MCI1700053.1 flagellin [Liquorilactobacillus nagelii]MCI1820208.1 flagellin [Carnobacterium maltaromaticum]